MAEEREEIIGDDIERTHGEQIAPGEVGEYFVFEAGPGMPKQDDPAALEAFGSFVSAVMGGHAPEGVMPLLETPDYDALWYLWAMAQAHRVQPSAAKEK